MKDLNFKISSLNNNFTQNTVLAIRNTREIDCTSKYHKLMWGRKSGRVCCSSVRTWRHDCVRSSMYIVAAAFCLQVTLCDSTGSSEWSACTGDRDVMIIIARLIGLASDAELKRGKLVPARRRKTWALQLQSWVKGVPVVVWFEGSCFVEAQIAHLFIGQLGEVRVERRQMQTRNVLVCKRSLYL